jgi:hypothetical protein
MGVSFRATIGPDDDYARTQILDKVPACASDGEKVHVVVDIAEDIESCMVLEEKIHLDTNAANVFEHV